MLLDLAGLPPVFKQELIAYKTGRDAYKVVAQRERLSEEQHQLARLSLRRARERKGRRSRVRAEGRLWTRDANRKAQIGQLEKLRPRWLSVPSRVSQLGRDNNRQVRCFSPHHFWPALSSLEFSVFSFQYNLSHSRSHCCCCCCCSGSSLSELGKQLFTWHRMMRYFFPYQIKQ